MIKSMLSGIVAKNMRKKLTNWTIKEEDVTEVLKQIRIALLDADVNLLVVKDFIKNIRQKAVGMVIEPNQEPDKVLLTIIKSELVKILGNNTTEISFNAKPLKIMMVGLQGSGKTTSIAKMANYFQKKLNKKVLLVALDIYRPAAVEQLRTLAKEINCDVFYKDDKSVNNIAIKAMDFAQEQKHDVILFDTAGRLQTDEKLMNELYGLKKIISPQEIIMVVDAMSGQDIINVAREFNQLLKLSGLVISKMDSQARAGAVLSITSMLNIPVKFVGTGEKVGSLDIFHPDRVADQILGLGDILTLVEKASEVVDQDRTKKSLARMLAGKFDLEDLMSQMDQMNKMGSMSSIAKMLPGNIKLSDEKIQLAETRMEVWKILLNSMTLKERRNPALFKKHPNRKSRVIKGAGRKPDELNKLLSEWEKAKVKMDEVAKNLKKGKNPFASMQNMFSGK